MSAPSFVRGIFAGAIHDSLLFPFPAPLDERDPDEARTVRRLLDALERDAARGLIDSARFDEEETIPEADDPRARRQRAGSALSIPREYGGLGLSPSAYAHVFGAVSSLDASLGVLVGVHCGLGSKAIVLFGTPEQKAALPADARARRDAGRVRAHRAGDRLRRAEHRDAARLNADGTLDRSTAQALDRQRPARRRDRDVRADAGASAATGPCCARRRSSSVPTCPGFRVAGTVRKMGIRGSTQAELVVRRAPACRPTTCSARSARDSASRCTC